jgi:heat shock protein HtpX
MILRDVRKNKIKTFFIVFLFVVFVAIFIYFVSYIIFEDAYIAVLFGVLISFLSSFLAYYNSDKIVLKLNNARPANKDEDRELNDILEGLSLATGLIKPKLYVMDDESMNAFATGRDPKKAVICVTTGLLNKLNKYELEGVVAHELSHIRNYDILLSTIIAVMAGFVVIISSLFRRGFYRRKSSKNENGLIMIIGLVFIILAPIVGKLIQLAVSRNREYLADSSAVEITRNKDGLINALKKLEGETRPLQTANEATAPMFIINPYAKKNKKDSILSTHPTTENRIKALEKIK